MKIIILSDNYYQSCPFSSFTSIYERCISWLMWCVLQKCRYLYTKIHGATFQKKEFVIFQLFHFGRRDHVNIYSVRLNTVPAEQPLLAYSHMHTQNTVWRTELASKLMLQCFQDCASIHQEVRHSHYKVFQHAQTKSCTCHEEWNSSSSKVPWNTVKETTKNFMFILCLWFCALLIYIINCPMRCNTKQSIYYSASSLYMFWVSTAPIIRSTQNCN